ncbi:alpha-L-rhamnosidase-related protein [Mucilaginibacter limnophilus]|uniref:alpha-L-rhamnosidase-related protein n=1 Tax=Mucilaginibacter limnophilus TaxID=1932778 RepID=UPI0013E29F92|nr:hypothetical protein [Mucilaginibacter limnophilus]
MNILIKYKSTSTSTTKNHKKGIFRRFRKIHKHLFITTLLASIVITAQNSIYAFDKNTNAIKINRATKTITIRLPNKTLAILIDYSHGCVIKQLNIKGKNTLSASGIYTGIKTHQNSFTSAMQINVVKVAENANGVTLSGINYGDDAVEIKETWSFNIKGDRIIWNINRTYKNKTVLDDMAFPVWNFHDLSVWKGGILDNGGMVWCKYLKQVNDTYGVHTGGITLWNAETGNGLRIIPVIDNKSHIASKYSHTEKGEFTCTQLITDTQLQQRYNLSRFVNGKADVFAPFEVEKTTVNVSYELQYIYYFKEYSRGTLPGIDAAAVRELMNTTGRYGVVDNNIIGANGWLTNWKCLHEPFFAQIGMALNDKNYVHNMAATLDQERDLAMLPDGRVLSRWHNAPGDEIPGTYNLKTGYYEAMWGYTIDSQPDYVINTSEQFDLSGDIKWLRSHQKSCEKALDWLIKRDANNNGIFEMMNNNIAENKASDWLDIVWASYENAFVNAQMYEALTLWANCEKILGDEQKAAHYTDIAARLKTAFNKPVEEGGFWSANKKQYVYWRDNDGTVHGNNLVTPVNFAAIAFALCDNPERIKLILDQIEQRSVQENLFHWPLCFDSFTREEVSGGNWPFPKYENGDIFPTWGYLGIRAYTHYDKAIALKYINALLKQYEKDGLSSQRYSRQTQTGLGDDILAGICTSITALYRDIYGLRPKWNRMGIEPNMSKVLNGTQFLYTLRDTVYKLQISVNNYTMSTTGFSVKSKQAFGASKTRNTLTFYPDNSEVKMLQITATSARRIDMEVDAWHANVFSFIITSANKYQFDIKGLQPNTSYRVRMNNIVQPLKTDANGILSFRKECKKPVKFHIRKEA